MFFWVVFEGHMENYEKTQRFSHHLSSKELGSPGCPVRGGCVGCALSTALPQRLLSVLGESQDFKT